MLDCIKVNDGLRHLWIPQYRYYTFILLLQQQKPNFLLNPSHTLIELLMQWIICFSKEQILTNEEIMEPWGINYFHNEGDFRIRAALCASSCRDFCRVNGLWDLARSLHQQRRSCSGLYYARRYERFSFLPRKGFWFFLSLSASKADLLKKYIILIIIQK